MSVEKSEHKVTILVEQSSLIDLIMQNLFSDDTERFFNSCEFGSERMAFMQGMNYAALLCGSNKVEKYFVHHLDPAVIQLLNDTLHKPATNNAELPVQAEWIDDGAVTICSNCEDRPVANTRSCFCPTCGAKMKNPDL